VGGQWFASSCCERRERTATPSHTQRINLIIFSFSPALAHTHSSVLEGADAGAFLREAVEATFARAVSLWARHTVGPLGE
jgi:hypothetical protein